MSSDSEFRTYTYIEQVLKDLSWNTRNPKRGGGVYTQHEFYNHDPLLTEALGRQTPENIVLVPWDGGHRYWIIEAKGDHAEREKALHEAQEYADTINRLSPGAARFATGIAGTPDSSFLISTTYWNEKEWREVAINNYQTTGFLSLEQCRSILGGNDRHLALFDDDPERFLRKANQINRALHRNEIPVDDRAAVMAALLLALAKDANLRIYREATRLIGEINGSIESLLKEHGKEEFAEVIKLKLPATEKNHLKYRQAIIDTLQHLREMNIRSAINSGDDALGKFYETFLKYANGAKEMGIVLTPRHITRFAVEVTGVGPQDRVFDPACGTGGFLISGLEAVRRISQPAYANFANEGLYGIEQRDDVYGLAMVNMIFRGDGKSHVYDGNCFDHQFWLRDGEVFYTLPEQRQPDGAKKPFSRVLMNPPFKLTANNETEFVDYGLEQMRPGGILFAVLPSVVIGGKGHAQWRKELLRRHSVLACVKFDKNLFYPVAEATYGLIVRGHEPHKSMDSVFMGYLFDDFHRPRRSKVLSDYNAVDNVERMTTELRRFLLGQPVEKSIPREQRVAIIKIDDDCSFWPEKYIASGESPILNPAGRVIASEASRRLAEAPGIYTVRTPNNLSVFNLDMLISEIETAPLMALKGYQKGDIPVVSATYHNNGVTDYLDIPDDLCLENCITISAIHNTQPCEAFWHPYKFSAISTVHVVRPIPALLAEPLAISYLCEAITQQNAWRYDYARPVQLSEIEVELPVQANGYPDFQFMAKIAKEVSGL